MKNIFLSFLVGLSFSLFPVFISGQIITDEPPEPPKKEQPEESYVAPELEIYAGFTPAFTYRTLRENEGLFGEPIEYREDEVGDWVTSFEAGIRSALNQHLLLELGMGYMRNRERYAFETENQDSIFRYSNTYRHLSFPIRLAYHFGDEISFYGGVGVMPKAFISRQRKVTTLDINNQEKEEVFVDRNGFNRFIIDAMASVGTRIAFNENYGIFAIAEGRYQLTNNFDEQAPFIRNPYSIGFRIGAQVYL
ncbi:MAG: hypothetical protein ACQERC_13765 [Bacteroidota bacterium]